MRTSRRTVNSPMSFETGARRFGAMLSAAMLGYVLPLLTIFQVSCAGDSSYIANTSDQNPNPNTKETATPFREVPVRVVHVQQYENKMPRVSDAGIDVRPDSPEIQTVGRRVVTLVEFEIQTCRVLTESDFEIKGVPSLTGEPTFEVHSLVSQTDCDGHSYPQSLVAASFAIDRGSTVNVGGRSYLVEQLPTAN